MQVTIKLRLAKRFCVYVTYQQERSPARRQCKHSAFNEYILPRYSPSTWKCTWCFDLISTPDVVNSSVLLGSKSLWVIIIFMISLKAIFFITIISNIPSSSLPLGFITAPVPYLVALAITTIAASRFTVCLAPAIVTSICRCRSNTFAAAFI